MFCIKNNYIRCAEYTNEMSGSGFSWKKGGRRVGFRQKKVICAKNGSYSERRQTSCCACENWKISRAVCGANGTGTNARSSIYNKVKSNSRRDRCPVVPAVLMLGSEGQSCSEKQLLFFPLCFARYSASSAFAYRSVMLVPSVGKRLMPMLADRPSTG